MKGIDELATKALELRESGMNDKEIARELHLSENTIVWLLTRGVEKKSPPAVDVKIGWTSAGVYGHRISYLANVLADIIIEEAERGEYELDTIVGIAINGIPLATNISDELGLEFAMYRPPHNKEGPGSLASNFANVDEKAVVLVDDVIDTGETMSHAIEEIKKMGGTPQLAIVLVNKSEMTEICGIPLRSIIRARAIY